MRWCWAAHRPGFRRFNLGYSVADKPSALPGVIVIKPSRLLALWACMAVAATAAFSLSYLPLAAAAPLCALALIFGTLALRLHALRSHQNSVVALRCGAGRMSCQLRSGRWIVGGVLRGGLISTWLTVVSVRGEADRTVRYVVLMPDAIAVADYRRLRVFLRWSGVGRGSDNL